MSYSIILSSDTLDIGRQKINSFMQSSTGVWSSDTPNYAVVSVQGASNSNTATGNYSFVTGKNNSANTGSFQVITGGYKNRVVGEHCGILAGTLNTQTNISGKYNTVVNGKSNTVNESDTDPSGIRRSYNTIINGVSNSIDGRENSILGGISNTIAGNTNFILGNGNRIAKNTTFAASTAKGPQLNTLMGGNNSIVGGELWYYNMIAGNNNSISAATGNNVESSFIFGSGNRIVGPNVSNVFMHGKFLSNFDTYYSIGQSNIFMIGKGTSLSTQLKPSPSNGQYQFILGSNATRRVRINFSSSPNAYLSSGGAWQVTGADYGEYFEWNDGNQTSEERVGYFVEIADGKIQIAKSVNAIGIASKTTAFIGDSNQDEWNGKYLKDEWGVPVMEKFQKFALSSGESQKEVYFDAEGFCYHEIPNRRNRQSVKIDVVKEQGTFIEDLDIQVENPDYNPEKRYIPRKDRKEWDVIGLLGKLKVRTSEQITGNAVDVDTATGTAKNGTTYPVLQKNKDFDGKYGIVTVFFK
jgi:hypothetical protein